MPASKKYRTKSCWSLTGTALNPTINLKYLLYWVFQFLSLHFFKSNLIFSSVFCTLYQLILYVALSVYQSISFPLARLCFNLVSAKLLLVYGNVINLCILILHHTALLNSLVRSRNVSYVPWDILCSRLGFLQIKVLLLLLFHFVCPSLIFLTLLQRLEITALRWVWMMGEDIPLAYSLRRLVFSLSHFSILAVDFCVYSPYQFFCNFPPFLWKILPWKSVGFGHIHLWIHCFGHMIFFY